MKGRIHSTQLIDRFHSSGNLEKIIDLLAGFVNEKNKDGLTPIHYAARNGNHRIPDLDGAIDSRAYNPIDSIDWLHFPGHKAIVQFLIFHGAQPLAESKNGWTPLRFAEINGNFELFLFRFYRIKSLLFNSKCIFRSH